MSLVKDGISLVKCINKMARHLELLAELATACPSIPLPSQEQDGKISDNEHLKQITSLTKWGKKASLQLELSAALHNTYFGLLPKPRPQILCSLKSGTFYFMIKQFLLL